MQGKMGSGSSQHMTPAEMVVSEKQMRAMASAMPKAAKMPAAKGMKGK